MTTQKYHFNSDSKLSNAFYQIMLCEIKHIKQWRKTAIKGKDPEGVHQLRVSLRRLRTVLVLFRPLLVNASSQRIAKKLKRYAVTLDQARDMDVFISNYLNSEIKDGQLSELAIKQRNQAYKKVGRLLKSDDFKQFKRRIKKWLKTSACPLLAAQHVSLNTFAAQTLEHYRQQVIEQAETLDLKDEGAIHQLRISCKKLRYASEFFRSLYPKKNIKPFIKQLEQLQDCLGTIHDCFVHKQMHQILMAEQGIVSEQNKLQQQANDISNELKAGLNQQFENFKSTPAAWHTE